QAVFSLCELAVNVAVTNDRTRNELRKHSDVRAEIYRISLRRRVRARNVNNVRQRLKGVKRDADGERKPKRFKMRESVDFGKVQNEKIGVFEKSEHREIKNYGKSNDPPRAFAELFSLFRGKTKEIVRRDRCDHQKDVNGLTPAVKSEAHQKQYEISPFQRREKIQNYRQRQI
ncbi:MAG: hypothetical protein IJW39_04945, partial [Opitutales bacterium]|nr:hypothetical protein [Opitutales bacterium]